MLPKSAPEAFEEECVTVIGDEDGEVVEVDAAVAYDLRRVGGRVERTLRDRLRSDMVGGLGVSEWCVWVFLGFCYRENRAGKRTGNEAQGVCCCCDASRRYSRMSLREKSLSLSLLEMRSFCMDNREHGSNRLGHNRRFHTRSDAPPSCYPSSALVKYWGIPPQPNHRLTLTSRSKEQSTYSV